MFGGISGSGIVVDWFRLLELTAPFVAAGFAAVVSIWAYYRQKEFELVQLRYLREGLDVLIATAESQLNVASHNWSESLRALQLFRDLDNVSRKDIERQYLVQPETRFCITANYRVKTLVNTELVWLAFQSLISYCDRAQKFIEDDMTIGLRKAIEHPAFHSKTELCSSVYKLLYQLNEQAQIHQVFVGQMHSVSEQFEQQNFSFKTLKNFRKKAEVQVALKNIADAYEEPLKRYAKDAKTLREDFASL